MTCLDRSFGALLTGLAVLSAAILAAITLVIPLNVLLRNLGLPVIYGALDAIEYGLMAAAFLGAPWVLRLNAHVQVDLITHGLPPRARRRVVVAACLLGAATCAVLGWAGLQALMQSYARGSMVRTAFTFPEWWTLTVLPLSMALCTLEFLRKIFRPEAADAPLSGL
ncbi:TRAP transporter small permease subunit [Leisingera aquaemixtae]|uniref:TRAP transporter small permease n=1 Tax=Leisingera aquaemixtae TaxID=1396826 RepID=UPI0021A4B6FC|nr:TRAP transporter small permease subunit [Leisingera aquaemixtae]UWQ24310.1 TRAP transporter small permease subunit [Leisingera aquaemixtae]UWQ36850.1 TRAP transporter small permease subunit [Leisingera aquaemixtae]